MDKYDFSGWVTKNDLKCSDGVTIRHNAFKANDNQKVPLVWNHNHSSPANVIGNVLLKNRDTGVYGYGFFNNTETAKLAKELVQHGDVVSMSIGARNVKRSSANDVIHGNIYEVSLVLAGANPGATIDSVITHSDEGAEEKIVVFTDNLIHSALYPDDEEIVITHADEDDNQKTDTKKENDEDSSEDDINDLAAQILASLTEDEMKELNKYIHKLAGNVPDDKIIDSLTQDQLDDIMNYAFELMEKNSSDEENDEEKDDKENEEMNHNVFDNNTDAYTANVELAEIKHAMLDDLVSGNGTLQAVAEFYSDKLLEHGITDIEQLFTVELDTNAPGWVRPEDPSLVTKIINGLKKTPRHTVHGRWADITEDEARARGYIKGNQKLEEVFTLLNRRTYPQTVYKKQSFDRDDWVDITDFDLIAWVKPEMKEMLNYELARAVLIGDGRATSSADKINETNIRPIATDIENNLFAQKVFGVTAATFVETDKRSRRLYRGNGKPSLYIDSELLTEIELIKDDEGRYLYGVGNRPATDEEIAQLVGCSECVAPEFMDGTGLAIKVNLNDYELACPSKGAAQMYDDFDIDFNKMKYLIETRVAGALNAPKSAVIYTTAAATYTAITNPTGNPSKNGWYELDNETYVLTVDTTVATGKTYYSAK